MEECNNFTVLWHKSPVISPESRFETGFYNRRLIPNESTYNRRFENHDPDRLCGIRRKNRPKQFQIENDPQKGGTIPGRSRDKPPLPDPGLHSLTRISGSSSSSRKPPCPSRICDGADETPAAEDSRENYPARTRSQTY